jgi:DNA-binding protein HU-beta
MQKTELVNVIAEKCGIPKAKAKDVLDCVTTTVTDTVVSGEDVTIQGFGSFRRVTRSEKKTSAFGKDMIVPKHYAMTFTVGSPVRVALAEKMTAEDKTK